MKVKLSALLACAGMLAVTQVHAQNWSLNGNIDATIDSRLGTNNAVPLRLFTNSNERLRITTDGRIGLGTTAPPGKFSILGGTAPASGWVSAGVPLMALLADGVPGNGDIVMAMASNDPAGRANLLYRRSRGTLAVPTAVQFNDRVGSFFASSYDGSTFHNAAALDFIIDGTPSSGNVPTSFAVLTGSNLGNRTRRLEIGSNGNFNFNSGQVFLNRASGNLGVGTATPADKLHVAGNQQLEGDLNFANEQGGIQFANPGASSQAMITMFKSGTVNPNRMVIAHSPAFPNWGLQYNDVSDQFNMLNNGNSVFSFGLTSGNLLMNGNIGVNATAPLAKLDVRRNDGSFLVARFANTSTTTGTDRTALIDIVNGSTIPTTWRLGVGGTNNGVGLGAGQFYIERLGIGPAFNIATNGNIGIGTVNPTYKLSVNGTIQAKEVRVESGWADYVFEAGYRLRPLTEVKSFIDKHKHLPGMPSAAEVQDKGLAVAEMQTKMMEKIEELTLYVIELQQQIETLKKAQK